MQTAQCSSRRRNKSAKQTKPFGQRREQRKAKKKERRAKRGRAGRNVQHWFDYPNTWGGRRKGAGRKPNGERPMVAHHERPWFTAEDVIEVTCRVLEGVPSLRSSIEAIEESLRRCKEKEGFRVIHYSVQRDHIHLIVEADDRERLGQGMRALNTSIAKRLNARWGRRGPVFHGRYHMVIKRSAPEVRNALLYLFRNGVKHGVVEPGGADPCCSIDEYEWTYGRCRIRRHLGTVVAPRTELLRVGHLRAGALNILDVV